MLSLANGAFENSEFEISAKAGALAYAQKQDSNIAYNTGCAFARASDPTQALVWLELAISAGFDDKDQFSTDPDLESIRSTAGFERLLDKLSQR